MLRERVAEHYRARGYRIHERVRVRGDSGRPHAIDLLAEGPMGAIVVSLDEEVEGPELSALRSTARDIGASAVAVAPQFTPQARAAAQRLGVVLLTPDALEEKQPGRGEALMRELGLREDPYAWPDHDKEGNLAERHPWPASGRARPAIPGGPARVGELDNLVQEWTEATQATQRAVDNLADRVYARQPGPGANMWKYGRDESNEKPTSPPSPTAPTAAKDQRFAWLQSPRTHSKDGSNRAKSTTATRHEAVTIPPPSPSLEEQASRIMRPDRPTGNMPTTDPRHPLPSSHQDTARSTPRSGTAPPTRSATTAPATRSRTVTPRRRSLVSNLGPDSWLGLVAYAGLTATFLFILIALLL